MPSLCVVPGCHERGEFQFPSDHKINKAWRVAVRRETENKLLWKPTDASRVCAAHFTENDFREPVQSYHSVGGRKMRLLNPYAVPSVFPHVPPPSDLDREREERRSQRKRRLELDADAGEEEKDQFE
jgi:hypothetical protein